MQKKRTVVVGVSGGIAAYKALDLVSKLKKLDMDVHVIMTASACEFVTPLSFQSLSQNYVINDMFAEPRQWEIAHISLAKRADLFVVVPATANIIGKVANGIADDMLSTTIMATKAPVLFAPAMNVNMYENPIVQKNIAMLTDLGYHFVAPASGRLACGDIGNGKLADVDQIVDHIDMLIHKEKDLTGKKVLVTAGPTREDIDPVRFITNRSTGKMGYAVARAARNRGAEVILVSGPVDLAIPVGIECVITYSAEDMYQAVIDRFDQMDIVIKSAAVSDYRPENISGLKIKKTDNDLSLTLTRNKDILKEIGGKKTKQILIGFAAETNDVISNAMGKIKKKNLDLIVANDVLSEGAGFGVDTNSVKIIDKDGNITDVPNMSKTDVAHEILNAILKIER